MRQNETIDVFHFVSNALIVDYCQRLACNLLPGLFFQLMYDLVCLNFSRSNIAHFCVASSCAHFLLRRVHLLL